MLTNAKAVANIPVMNLARAREFYEEKLGLKYLRSVAAGTEYPGAIFQCGDGTQIELYQRATLSKAEHTLLSFRVADVESEVKELKKNGVVFEEYDLPGLKTVDSIANLGEVKVAWFKDTEGNTLGVAHLLE